MKVLAPREAGRLTSHLHTAKLRSTWPQRGVTQVSIETAIHFQERNKSFKVSSPKRTSNHHLDDFSSILASISSALTGEEGEGEKGGGKAVR